MSDMVRSFFTSFSKTRSGAALGSEPLAALGLELVTVWARVSYLFSCTLLLCSLCTSRGHMCRPFSPLVLAFNFYRAYCSAILLLVDFSSNVANSRSRAFRKLICEQEKVPTKVYENHLGNSDSQN